MTHSLHRQGTAENLKNDIVFIFCPAKHLTEAGSAEKTKKFIEIVTKHNPAHYGDDLSGNVLTLGPEQLYQNVRDLTNIHVCFSNLEDATNALAEIVKADLGISVVVSGLFDQVKECCNKAHTKIHSIEHSLGFGGKTELLPDNRTLEVITMCGHGLVSANLVQSMVTKISKGKLSAAEAAKKMATLCLCGIFNPDRAERLLQAMADSLKQ